MNATTFIQDKNGFVFETFNPDTWKDCQRITKKAGIEARKQQAIEQLKNILSEGDTVYTVLRHRSASGMSRRIDLYIFRDNQKHYLTGLFAHAMGEKAPEDGYKVGGCGMDMGFHLVYTLSSVLFPEDRKNGGYKLNHEWI
jgi:hypothetical protein